MKIPKFCLAIFIILVSHLLPALGDEALQIGHGLTDYQVYQRDATNLAKIVFKVETIHSTGTLQARVLNLFSFGKIMDWQPVATLENGKATGILKNLPVGGPYLIEIELRNPANEILAQTNFKHILVGDLWLLAGQSNMQGIGALQNAEAPSVHVNMFGFNEKWTIAADPLHWLLDSIDEVHHQNLTGETLKIERERVKKNPQFGSGLGMSFAKKMVAETNVPIGLIPCAHGGTSMKQWAPELKDQAGKSLYGSMLRRFHETGGKVTGVLWYQGESDANADAARIYTEKFTQFIQSVRKDFDAPNLPFYLVQIGRLSAKVSQPPGGNFAGTQNCPFWNMIREQQRRVAEALPHTELTPSIDLGLEHDFIHIDTGGLKRLGHRLANFALKDIYGQTELQPGPRLEFVSPVPALNPCYKLVFSGLNGRLKADGRPGGFAIYDTLGNDLNLIYETVISFDGQSIDLYLRDNPPTDAQLWYGYGLDPYCNITDDRDMGLPAFGPVGLDGVDYNTFVRIMQENPGRPEIPFLLQRVVPAMSKTKPDEILKYTRQAIAAAPADKQVALFPFLFALGDFSNWQNWLSRIRKATVLERRELTKPLSDFTSTDFLKVDFIREWQMAGPFDNVDDNGLDRQYSPEKQPTGKTYVNQNGQAVTWQTVVTNPDNYLDFTRHITGISQGVVYVRVQIDAPQEMEVPVLFGSNDGVAVHVNDREIFYEKARRVARPAEDLALMKLRKGKNILLVKVDQIGGGWGLYLQVLDRSGKLKISLP